VEKRVFFDNAEEPVDTPSWYLTVGADPCVRPAGTIAGLICVGRIRIPQIGRYM